MTTPPPRFDALAALASGELSPEEAAAVEAAAAAHADSARRLARLREIIGALRTDDGVEPDAATVGSAKATLRRMLALRQAPERSEAPAPWWERLRAVVARCVFDSRGEPALAMGFRGAEDARRLSFEASTRGGPIEIDLQLDGNGADAGRGRQVIGQVSAASPCAGWPVALKPADRGAAHEVAATRTDAAGMFTLDAAPGRYDLLVGADDALLVMQDIEVL